MDTLGFDLYTQMLERTVAELRGEVVEDETSVSSTLGVDVAIPDEYISDMGQRLRTYKRVSSSRMRNVGQPSQRNSGSLWPAYGAVEQLLAMPGCAG